MIRYWNGKGDVKPDPESGIWLMNYWQLTQIIDMMCSTGESLFSKIKIVVFDECHTIYSDRFIKEMIGVRVWLRERIARKDTMIIGLTATPGILFAYGDCTGIKTKVVNKESFINYKVQNLICTTHDRIPELFYDGILSGMSIIMCNTFEDCMTLQKQLSNSVALCSANNKKDTHEMQIVRDYIINHSMLPSKMSSGGDLKVLIATTTMREGINLISNSGIKNVISCVTDELHVKQFVGRCRFNVENLVVAYHPQYTRANDYGGYLTESRTAFRNYVANPSDREWFDSVSEVMDCKFEDIVRYGIDCDKNGFNEEFESKYCSVGDVIYVWSAEQKDDIVQMAQKHNFLDKPKYKYTYTGVIKAIEQEGVFAVVDGRFDNKELGQRRYKVFMRKELNYEAGKDE